MTSDLIIIGLFIAALFTNKRQVQISMSAYCCTVIYACLFLGKGEPYDDHIVYAALCVPFMLISGRVGAYGLCLYATFNIAVAIDYLFYPNVDTILSSNFTLLHLALAFCLVFSSLFGGYNGDRIHHTFIEDISDRLGGLWGSYTRSSKMERK